MFTEAFGDMKMTTVTVRTRAGIASDGEVLAAPAPVAGYLSDSRTMVRDRDGSEVVSESRFYTDLDQATLFPPYSEVALPDRSARVIRADRHEIGDPDVDHCEIVLT